MSGAIPQTLQEIHEIGERIAQEQARLSTPNRVEATRREADALLKAWGVTLKQALPPSRTPQ